MRRIFAVAATAATLAIATISPSAQAAEIDKYEVSVTFNSIAFPDINDCWIFESGYCEHNAQVWPGTFSGYIEGDQKNESANKISFLDGQLNINDLRTYPASQLKPHNYQKGAKSTSTTLRFTMNKYQRLDLRTQWIERDYGSYEDYMCNEGGLRATIEVTPKILSNLGYPITETTDSAATSDGSCRMSYTYKVRKIASLPQ